MGRSCTIMAHVINSRGEVVESNLFRDLLHFTSNNREIAKEYYKVGTSEEFLSKVRDREDFEVDENGEITFKSLNNIAKVDIETDKLIDTLNKDIHSGKYSYEEALKKVQYFNENNVLSDRAMATMVLVSKNQYFVSVIPVTKNTTDSNGKEKKEIVNTDEKQHLHEVIRNKEMEKRILDILQRHKVSAKFIEGESEGGRYSTENIKNAENGLYGLIEVVENGNTTDVLAEEAGHFAVGALGEYPLVKRIENLLSEDATRREVLGEEEYEEALLGNNPAREVAGKLVGKALQRKLGNGSIINVLANRIANLAKRVFYNFTGNEVRWAAAKAEQIANNIAYNFANGSDRFSVQNAINIPETMHNASLTVNGRVYKKILNELGMLNKNLEAIARDTLSKELQATFGMTIISGSDNGGKNALQYAEDHAEAMADSLAFDGIVQAMAQITDYLGPGAQVDKLMQAVDLSNPSEFYANMARNGRNLHQARTLLRSAEVIINTVALALDKNHLGGMITSNGSTLEDAKYQDLEGNWHSLNLKHTVNAYKTVIAGKASALTNLESAYFARFCEDIYGKKYVSRATGVLWTDIWKGLDGNNVEQQQTIADMVEGIGIEDIDILHRFIGSMSNNPDIIGQIIDKLVKQCNKNADDLTLKYRDRLSILKDRAEKLGFDVSELVERDENGLPTGNIITPPAAPTENGNLEEDFICKAYMQDIGTDDAKDVYAVNHGKWEKAREEYKKQVWEDFKKDNPDWQSMTGFIRGMKWDDYLRRPEHSMKSWNRANSIKVVVKDENGDTKYVKWVPNALYKTDAWEKLEAKHPKKQGANDSLRKWMGEYMAIKQELDSMLPEGATQYYRLPQFRGTFINSVRNKALLKSGVLKGARALGNTFGRRAIMENFIETADDQDFGDMTTMNNPDEELLGTKLDYEGERASRLPIFGVNKLKNMVDLSTDILESTCAYASMATTYAHLSSIVSALEVGRSALVTRDKNIDTSGLLYKEGSMSRAYTRYCKFLDKQVYGIHAPYYGLTIWKGKRILLNKIVQNLSSLAGTMFLKGNVLGGAVNTLTGVNNIFKEACTGEYFDLKDWAAANKYYYKSFMSMWTSGCIPGFDLGAIHFSGGDLGNLVKSNRLDLFLEQMNALSDNKEKFRNWHTKRSRLNNFYRMVGYLPYSAGDHYMQAMSYLSVAHGTKLYNENGTEASNLWNAWEKRENSDDKQEYKHGYTLEFKRFCPADASQITAQTLNTKGFYLKKVQKTKGNFHTWLYSQDSQFADKGYLGQNINEYEDYKKKFGELTDKELMQFQSNRIATIKSILTKVENYLSSPLSQAPNFSPSELEYLKLKGLGTGDYSNIITKTRNDIYNMIWTKLDESAYMDHCREVNDRLHGIYNQQDKTAWHNNIYFNAFLAMKGWALGNLEYIMSPNHYSITLGKDVEGFANTALKVPFSAVMGAMYKNPNRMRTLDVLITMFMPWTKRSKNAMKRAGFTENQNYNARRMAMSAYLITSLLALCMTCAPSEDDYEEEIGVMQGLIYYLSYRTLLEQRALLEPTALYKESGSLMDFIPVGVAAVFDLWNLCCEGIGALISDEDNSTYYYQDDSNNERYEEGDSKFGVHAIRLIPYWKSLWAIEHPVEAKENYEFGRKLRSR